MTKRHRVFRIGLLIALQLGVAGCIATWARVEPDTRVVKNDYYSVTAPVGWMRLEGSVTTSLSVKRGNSQISVPAQRLTLTRDGLNLDRIEVTYLASANAFPHINKELKASMLPPEIAQSYIADIKAAGGLENLKVVSNKPRVIAGEPGFEVLVEYYTPRGLKFQRLTYGFASNSGMYLLWFEAPSIHYFGTYQEVFNRVVTSFKPTVTSKA